MSTTAPSLLILGTDTMLAAAPATAVQLTHACLSAGFDAVVPSSWGDELVAARVLERVAACEGPVVQCSCPRVLERLGAHGEAIAPMLICTVSPVGAVAEYLRALYAPGRPSITFAGRCPGGASDGVDQWISPSDLVEYLAGRGVAATDQPTEFDRLPPDRRRFHSEPGGMPAVSALRRVDAARRCVEVDHSDFIMAVGQHLLADEPVLVDLGPALGCACAGAGDGVSVAGARARVREHEPPRAPSAIVDHGVPVVLDAELPRARRMTPVPLDAAGRSAVPPVSPPTPATPASVVAEAAAPSVAVAEHARRRSPPGMPRPVLGSAPRTSRPDGRALPRAYVARRRSSPRGMRSVPAEPAADSIRRRRDRLWWAVGGVLAGGALVWLARLLG